MSREIPLQDVRRKFQGYRYQDMASNDAHSLHKNFRSLKPADQKTFTHSNGTTENLVSMTGTIPVKIRGQQYNIPICIWIRRNHPYVSPLVFVTPTSGMGIQQSQYVDTNGMVYLPYISDWKANQSDMTTLVQIMCATFAEHCPVYSKATPPQAAQPPYNQPRYAPQPQPQPRMPYPQQHPRQPYGQTPYPTAHGGMPMPSAYNPPPTSGTRPPYYATGQPPYPPTSTPGYPPTSTPGYPPTSTPGYPQHQPRPPSQPTSSYYPQNPAASVTAVAAPTVSATPTKSAEDERKEIEEQERIKRQSLETAVEDKIRRQVKQVMDAAEEEMETMLHTQEELKEGSQKINAMLQDMENKKHEVESSIDVLRSKNAELESMLDYLRAQPDKIDVDDAVSATSPLYNQILQLYAEENALDDTIYYLGEALRKGVIELEVFLKYVRELSRQQFMARATIMKGRSTAGLPEYGTL